MLQPRRRTRAPAVHLPPEDLVQMQIVDHERLRLHRVAKRYTLRRVADLVGCSHTQVAKYETGKKREIPEDWAQRLSLILEVPMASVFRPVEGFVMPESSNTQMSSSLQDTA